MDTNTAKRVNITLPKKTLNAINRVAPSGDRSRFINAAVMFYMEEIGRRNLRKELQEGARARSARDTSISVEWFTLDEEAWWGNAR